MGPVISGSFSRCPPRSGLASGLIFASVCNKMNRLRESFGMRGCNEFMHGYISHKGDPTLLEVLKLFSTILHKIFFFFFYSLCLCVIFFMLYIMHHFLFLINIFYILYIMRTKEVYLFLMVCLWIKKLQ